MLKKLFLFLVLSFMPCYAHDGLEPMDKEELHQVISEVVKSIPGIKRHEEWTLLLLETAAVETSLGNYNVPYKCKGSYGTFQILESTANDLLKWMQSRDTQIPRWREISELYDGSMSHKSNLEQNIKYGAAIALMIYVRMNPKMDISTREKRAIAWKTYYNSCLGSGTREGYMKRCHKYLGAENEL